jgi:hypothetical protein
VARDICGRSANGGHQWQRRGMNAPKHQDPSASVKIGWGTAATLAVVACAVLAVAVWGGLQLSRHASGDGRSAGGGRGAGGVSGGSSPSTAPPRLEACRHALGQGDRLAAAADAAYRDWATHVDAQLDFDRGQSTLAETQAMWAASRKRGAADVRSFAAARAGWGKVARACSSAPADAGPARAAAQACLSRQEAVRAVAARGAEVNEQWAAHLQMMADKAHADGAAYSRRWRQMVQDAPPVLKDYAGARRQLDATPRCKG